MEIYFSGVYNCKADAKGRVMLPISLRNQMAPLLHDGFFIKKSYYDECLEFYPDAVWKAEVKKGWKEQGGSKSFGQIREDETATAQVGAVIWTDGKIKTDLHEMVQEIAGALDKLFNNKEVDAAAFLAEYGHLIPKGMEECKLPVLDKERFWMQFNRMTKRAVPQTDGG